MALDDIKKRFVDEIKLRAYDDKFLDKNEEREILQIAIQQGVSIDSARGALQQVCEHQGYVLESSLVKTIKDQIVHPKLSEDGVIRKLSTSTILVGRSGSGKSVLLHNLLTQPEFFHK